ncbi:MAG: histidine phosphatase family protein [Anaerocolumna sp.]|jgi:broad specificity phosphatase PhoE|nr:histidine phosphatase family protein [Anaerocolumna sp.]
MDIIFIRHGEPDYILCDDRGFIGQGRDMAPLSQLGIEQSEIVSRNEILFGSQLIVSSPYTRALQTAAIISKNTQIPIQVEVDLHEFIPDKTFRMKGAEESHQFHKDFCDCKGVYPIGETKNWETIDEIISRVKPTLNKYMSYNKIIVVAHGGVIRRFVGKGLIEHCYPYKVEYNSDFTCYYWV